MPLGILCDVKYIQSPHNENYQRLLRLAQGKGQGGGGAKHVLLEGVHLCEEWLRHRGQAELVVFDKQRLMQSAELQALRERLGDTPAFTCPPNLIKKLSQVPAPQGVFFFVTIAPCALPSSITENSLWLDRIQDPGNVGTLLRTAAAADVKHIFASTGCADLWSPKVLRAAQGAHFALSLFEHVDLLSLRRALRIPLLASSLMQADKLFAATLPKTCAWIFGNEGQGIRSELLMQADQRICIPQSSVAESLNVTVAAGICLFEQRRQHGVV